MFSLCIPTMDRFDKFLSRYLVKYLENEDINEIIITDENGSDIEKIKRAFPDNPKLVLIKNEQRLGPLLNKLKACSNAKNEWIVLMDSDNFLDVNSFNSLFSDLNFNDNTIYAPVFARPKFNFKSISNFNLDFNIVKNNFNHLICFLNTGNYLVPKKKYLEVAKNIDYKFVEYTI